MSELRGILTHENRTITKGRRSVFWHINFRFEVEKGFKPDFVRRSETPEIKYLSHRSLITLCSLGIENGFSPTASFLSTSSASPTKLHSCWDREPTSDGRVRSTSSCTIKVHKNRVVANKAKLANNGLNKGFTDDQPIPSKMQLDAVPAEKLLPFVTLFGAW